jgi:Uma2 family endonuclease
MQQIKRTQIYYTPEEYLELEDKAEEKSEYFNGEIFTMAGASVNHNRIINNLYFILRVKFEKLKQFNCEVFTSDIKIWIEKEKTYAYPDLLIINGEPVYVENRNDMIANPKIIIEVLSDSTQNFDRNGKFDIYRTLPSLQEYILVSQDKIQIEYFNKIAEKHWEMHEYNETDSRFSLANFPVEIVLQDVYENVEFKKKF